MHQAINEDDDPPAFPAMMWMPALQWMLHGVGGVGFTIYVIVIKAMQPDDTFASLIIFMALLALILSLILLTGGIGVFRGYYASLMVALISSIFFGGIGIIFSLLESPVEIFALAESMLFLSSGVIAILYRKPWCRWRQQRLIQRVTGRKSTMDRRSDG